MTFNENTRELVRNFRKFSAIAHKFPSDINLEVLRRMENDLWDIVGVLIK